MSRLAWRAAMICSGASATPGLEAPRAARAMQAVRAPPANITRTFGIRGPAMTRLVRDMEAAGLVGRGADEADGRGVRVEITERGRVLQESVRLAKIGLIATQLQGLDADDRAAVAQAMAALVGIIELG